jgi:hypothetical protein
MSSSAVPLARFLFPFARLAPHIAHFFSMSESEMCGGYSKHETVDQDDMQFVHFAVAELAKQAEFKGAELVNVKSVSTQVVAGRNVNIVADVKVAGETIAVSLVVFDQPWTKTRQLSKVERL